MQKRVNWVLNNSKLELLMRHCSFNEQFSKSNRLVYIQLFVTWYFWNIPPLGGGGLRLVTSGCGNHLPSRMTSPLEDDAGKDALSCCSWNERVKVYANLLSPRYLAGATKYTSSDPAVSILIDPLTKEKQHEASVSVSMERTKHPHNSDWFRLIMSHTMFIRWEPLSGARVPPIHQSHQIGFSVLFCFVFSAIYVNNQTNGL